MELFHCFRCGNVWRPRKGRVGTCPLCKSRLWNEPRAPLVRPFDTENQVWIQTIAPNRLKILETAQRHHARHVRVFGSVRRGEARDESDVDLLVRMDPGSSTLDQIALRADLERLLGRRVDVVADDAIYWYLRPQILAEAIPL